MAELKSADGRYLAADQEDGNFVLYHAATMTPIWDRWSAEAVDQPPFNPPHAPPVHAPAHPAVTSGGVRLIRVTDERDGELLNRGYSYYSQAWISGSGLFYLFAGHVDNHPRFFSIDPSSGAVHRHGSLVHHVGTGEGWYFDASGWIYLCDGPRLHHVDPQSGVDQVVLDISDSHPGCVLKQAHSSDDGQTHSATVARVVSDGPYPHVGTVVIYHGQQEYYPKNGDLDESQITPDGGFLVIKESEDNRIITLGTRETRYLRDADGAVGHSDCGPGIVVGEDNIHGACVLWNLREPLTPERRRTLFSTWNMGHVSIRGWRCLVSGGRPNDYAFDGWLYLANLHGGGLTPLIDPGMTGSGYDYQVHANLDPTGRVACWLSNKDGRLDAYLMELP